ncbi:Putative odorant receptor 13a [Trachymyrmex zeteki]|uniref:Putative odorant receptor 13a n=1 Tax=Mycetomoellerius zeteki TaxID=64791 RepID=A0A151WGT8_9HYME|nr:Putative odorant receptor 13a [Trachymyrmex zeteki]
MAKSVDNIFNLILLDELFGNSVVLAISLYYVMMNLDISEIPTCFTFIFFAITALVMLFGYCLIGEQLAQQCISVQNAYYQCNWYQMPLSFRKCLLICMIRGQVILYLTAGRFYIFSLNSFTDDQKDLDRAAKVLSWNKRLMSTLGLWPFQSNDLIFSINFGYFALLLILEYLDFFLYIGDFEHVIMNLTESIAFVQIFVRMSTLRLYNDEIGEVITEAMKDFDKANYKTAEEIKTFVTYYAKSRIFFKLMMVFVTITASSYYLTPILIILGNGGLPEIVTKENVTQIIYLLPYRFHVLYAIENMRTYTITYAWQMPFAFISAFGQSTADCIMITLVFHICGQMSVLALRINNIDTEVCDCGPEMRHVMLMHVRLLRMGKIIGKAFSATLLAHLLGATCLVSILGYQMLTNLSKGETGVVALLVKFFIFIFLVLLILYAHCTIGENLLTESAKVCEAFYNCRWYDMSKNNARMLILCMARSQKPLCLIAGKFTMFCLSTLTDVLKTSMGYLSVLRSLL